MVSKWVNPGTACRAALLGAAALTSIVGTSGPAQATRHGGCTAPEATAAGATTPRVRCRGAKSGRGAAITPAGKAPAIESGGTSPAVDNTIPLLKPGTFRLDLAGFAQIHPILGIGPPRPSGSDLFESFTLGYGVNPRLTVFAGALEVNGDHAGGPYQANDIDPKVGFLYRLAEAPQLHGNTLDFVGDVTVNEPFADHGVYGDLPLSSLGPVGRARLLLARQIAPGFTLEAIGGLQAGQVTTSLPLGGFGRTTTDVDALFGLAGQYRLSAFSNRLYVNGELDVMAPLTDDSNQLLIDTPFKTSESYAATIGASYVLEPGSIIVRATDTVSLDFANPHDVPPFRYSAGRELFNTVGLTLSFCNLEPGRWLNGATR